MRQLSKFIIFVFIFITVLLFCNKKEQEIKPLTKQEKLEIEMQINCLKHYLINKYSK